MLLAQHVVFSQGGSTMPWYAIVAIVAIVCGAVTQIVSMTHKHRERLEMIRHGMNPDPAKGRDPEL